MSRENGQIRPFLKSIRILILEYLMSYMQKKYRCRNIIEVKQYHTARYGAPGQPRQKKTKPTPEAVKKQNQRRKEEKVGRIIAANFDEGDYVRTLTFAPAQRPADMKEAQAALKDFYQKLRREYRKRYFDLLWIANIEVTPRGAWHVHFICNAIFGGGDLIKELWPHGGVYDQLIRDITRSGNELGAYMAKTPDSTAAAGEHRVAESKLTHSKNLVIPEAEEKAISGWKLEDAPRVPKGWYLIKDSYFEGTNMDGYRFRTFKLARLNPLPPRDRSWKPPAAGRKRKRNAGRHLHGGKQQKARQR